MQGVVVVALLGRVLSMVPCHLMGDNNIPYSARFKMRVHGDTISKHVAESLTCLCVTLHDCVCVCIYVITSVCLCVVVVVAALLVVVQRRLQSGLSSHQIYACSATCEIVNH